MYSKARVDLDELWFIPPKKKSTVELELQRRAVEQADDLEFQRNRRKPREDG